MSSSVKQQPISPTAYESFSNEFYRHRSSTGSMDNDRLTPTMNNSTDSASTSAVLSNTNEPSRGPAAHDDKRHCAVCSDVASGYHYGVWSCEGCKAFFKRSIQGTNDYICPATNTCTIDKHRRKSCQACRLRRCYEVGMTKGTARRERKYRKKAVSVCKITSTSNASKHTNKQDHLLSVSTSSARASTATPTSLPANTPGTTSLSSQQQQLQAGKSTSDSSRVPNSTIDFLATLSQASRLNLPAKIDPNRSLDDHYFLQLLAKIFDQELVVLINWAKAIPGYTENLTLDQQVTMIEQSWLDSLLLDVIERSLERNDDALQFAPDFVIPRNRELNSPILSSTCTYLFNILQAFKDPRTTHEEFLALKATMLINSIPASVSSTKAFRILTNQIYQTVYHTCDSNPSVYQDNYSRHFTLLLQLPHIKVLSLKLIRLFLEMRNNDLLPQADLLLEMLEAQDSVDVSFPMDVDAQPPPPPPKTFSENPLATRNISPSSSFSIDNPSLYPPQFPGMSASPAQLLNLSQKRPSSTPSFSNYVETDSVSPSSAERALKNSPSASSTPPAQL